jgi:hypothetical protein
VNSGAATPEKPPPFQVTVTGDITRGADSIGFVPAQSLETGDNFRLTIRSTHRVRVYVAYCDANQELEIYPASGELYALADTSLFLPESGSFTVDQKIGRESLYVIAAASPLETTDPALARKLAAVGQSGGPACAAELEMTTNESRATVGLAPIVPDEPPKVASGPKVASIPRKKTNAAPNGGDIPEEWRPRGIGVKLGSTAAASVGSDASGIAILAFRKPHIR